MCIRDRSRIRAGEPLHFTMHVKSRDGQALWLQVNATCVDWQEGCPVYLVIFIDITDVTELREMQRKLIAQTEALKDALSVAEQANRAKSDFLSRTVSYTHLDVYKRQSNTPSYSSSGIGR